MGHRTTIIIDNDNLDILLQDQFIGRKICEAIVGYNTTNEGSFGPLGQVIEQSHADITKLGILGACGQFNFIELSRGGVQLSDPLKDITLDLIKGIADELGYRLTKKPIPHQG